MTTIKFIQHDGREYQVCATDGDSLMRVANDHNVPGILADCGGSMSCATCHVYLSEEWTDRMDPPSDEEVSMLEMAVAPQSNSRLSCQIIVTSELHGLLVNIPEKQF